MENQVSSIVFLSIIVFLTYAEEKHAKGYITPFTVSAWPFVIISLLVNFFLVDIKFPYVSVRAHYFVLINLLIFWIVGYLFSRLNIQTAGGVYTDLKGIFKPFVKFELIMMITAILATIAVIFRMYALIGQHGGWIYMGDYEFEVEINKGIIAHLFNIAKVMFIFLIFIYPYSKKKLLIFATLIFILIGLFIIQIKYNLFWLLLMIFFLRNLPKSASRQLRNIIILGLILAAILISFFLILTVIWGTFDATKKGVWQYLINAFLNYFVTGFILLDDWMNYPGVRPEWAFFAVFMNTINVLMGNPERIRAVNYLNMGFIEVTPQIHSNVGTSFGAYYLIGGYPFTILFSIITSVIAYYLYFKYRNTTKILIIYFNLFILSICTLQFFSNFLSVLPFYELSAFFIIILMLLRGALFIINLFKHYE
jgi:oligosaccharide repeat unit polymerase